MQVLKFPISIFLDTVSDALKLNLFGYRMRRDILWKARF